MRTFVALVLLFTALSMGLHGWHSSLAQAQLREQVLLQAEQRSLQLADAMAGQVDGVLSSVDLALNQLRHDWQRADPEAFAQVVRDTLEALPAGFVSHAVVANADGLVLYDSLGLGLGVGVNIADRDYFRSHLKGGDDLVVGEPVRSRLDGRWVFAVSRPLLLKDRSFAGTVHLTLTTEFLADRLAGLALSDRDVVALIQPNGRFLARSRDNARAMEQTVPPDRPFMANTTQRSGVIRVAGLVDGVPRIYGWHRMPHSGAVVAVGLAEASVLEPLAPVLERGRWLAAGLSLLLLGSGSLIAVLVWRVSRGQAAVGVSEARLKEAQRLAHVGDWAYDIAHDRLTWSDEVYRIFGLDPAQGPPTRERFYALVHPQDRERVVAAYAHLLQQRKLFHLDHRIVLPDGTERMVREACMTEYEGDQPVRSVGTVQDITETRTAQLALQQLNEQLEQRVAARTRELGALNQELEAFAYSVSHDLRTPLRSIHGYASLLEEGATRFTAEERSHLQRIQSAAKRMGLLITDLLTMAQHSRAVVRHQPVNLSELARAIASELALADPGRRVQWDIEDGLVVQADPELMRVVLQNLLGNAWKYTGRKEQAQIGFARTGRAGGMAEFCVRDNGAGFDMAHAQQLFQPFKRMHSEQQFEGTGVGLASVQRLVQRHGGTVRGEGVVGQGAAFYFSLPDPPPDLPSGPLTDLAPAPPGRE